MIAILLIAWAIGIVVVLSLCRVAAESDRAIEEQRRERS